MVNPINATPNQQPPANTRMKDSIAAMGYGALSILALTAIGILYGTGTCKTEPIASYGVAGLGMNCNNVEKSTTVNFILPTFALGAAIKAKSAFKRAMSY